MIMKSAMVFRALFHVLLEAIERFKECIKHDKQAVVFGLRYHTYWVVDLSNSEHICLSPQDMGHLVIFRSAVLDLGANAYKFYSLFHFKLWKALFGRAMGELVNEEPGLKLVEHVTYIKISSKWKKL